MGLVAINTLEAFLLANGALTAHTQYIANLLLFEVSQISYSKRTAASVVILGAQGLMMLTHFCISGIDQYIQIAIRILACAFELVIYASNSS